MTARLVKLLIGSFLFFCLGIALFPALFPTQKDRVTKVKNQPSVVTRDTVVDDWSHENEVEDSDDAWVEDEPEDDTPDRRVARMDDETFDEEDVPIDPKQNVVPEARVHAEFTSALAEMRKMAGVLEKQEKENFVNDDFPAASWADPEKIYFTLADRVLSKLGKMDDKAILKYMQDPASRLDLARITLIRKAGSQGIRTVSVRPKGKELLGALSRDLNWMTNLLHSGPSQNMEQALCFLETIYGKVGEKELENPVTRRIATTTALEFAREGWSESDMLNRFNYYNDVWTFSN